jgi:glycogen debranching enzyme
LSRNNHELHHYNANPDIAGGYEVGRDEPRFPILHKSEVDLSEEATSRLREQLSEEDRRYLRPEEKVVAIDPMDAPTDVQMVDPDEVLRLASNSPSYAEIGEYGSTVASINLNPSDGESRYEAEHGRDALIAAKDVLHVYPRLLESTVMSLAASQGVEDEPFVPGKPYGFEKPGSIILLNKDPDDPVARKFRRLQKWRFPFYASADAPARFIHDGIYPIYLENPNFLSRGYNSRKGYVAEVKEALDLSSQWLLDRAAENPEGLIEYNNPVDGGGGMRHQGWRDSAGAMVHADGTWANSKTGVASMEIQAVSYDALTSAAQIYRDYYGNEAKAQELEEAAAAIQRTVIDKGWVNDPVGGYFALGFDRDDDGRLRPLEVKTPMPDLLKSRLLRSHNLNIQEMTKEYIMNLLTPDVLTKWGLRSMSSHAVAFGPKRYHEGRVWTHINDAVGESMSSHGFFGIDRLLGSLTTRVCELAGCYPETIVGLNSEIPIITDRDVYVYNELYDEVYRFDPASPRWQTWAATAQIAKRERYKHIPEYAIDPNLRQEEARLLKSARELVLSV